MSKQRENFRASSMKPTDRGGAAGLVFYYTLGCFRGGGARYRLRLWWPHAINSLVSATACPCCLRKPSWPWSAPATAGVHGRAAQRSSLATRHAVGGLAARDLWAWCSSFFSWLPPSHGLARACLHQGGTFRCAATTCTSALTGMLRLPHSAVPWQVGGSLQRLSRESILSIPKLLD